MIAAISPADINYEETLSTLRHEAFIISVKIFLFCTDLVLIDTNKLFGLKSIMSQMVVLLLVEIIIVLRVTAMHKVRAVWPTSYVNLSFI